MEIASTLWGAPLFLFERHVHEQLLFGTSTYRHAKLVARTFPSQERGARATSEELEQQEQACLQVSVRAKGGFGVQFHSRRI